MKSAKLLASKSIDSSTIPISKVISQIVTLNRGLRDFWSSAEGWAPLAAASLLSRSRLDRQVSLSETLTLWFPSDGAGLTDGQLILAWANLGSLIEGTMKLFLSVHYADYAKDVDALKNGKVVEPEGLTLEQLRQFFVKKQLWPTEWNAFVAMVQSKRNAIHAFKDKDIGTQSDYAEAVRRYLALVRKINNDLPYPDDFHIPREH